MSNKSKALETARIKWRSTSNPVISFPIATYNRFDILLNRTIPSILNQGYDNIEIVVVGDSVSDSRYRHIAGIDPRIRFFNLSTRTFYPDNPFNLWCIAGYRPRNIAARICVGQWHWWISDDDFLEPGAISALVRFVNDNSDLESIYGNYRFYKNNVTSEMRTLENSVPALDFPITGMPSWINRCYISQIFRWSGSSYLNNTNKPSDYDLQQRMWDCGVRFGYINRCLAAIKASEEYGWMHGSQLYLNHPEAYN